MGWGVWPGVSARRLCYPARPVGADPPWTPEKVPRSPWEVKGRNQQAAVEQGPPQEREPGLLLRRQGQ